MLPRSRRRGSSGYSFSSGRFTWDPKKAKQNLKDHKVSFEEATSAFKDPRAVIEADLAHHDRLILLGMSDRVRVLYVVHAVIDEETDQIRIISARKAEPSERLYYTDENVR